MQGHITINNTLGFCEFIGKFISLKKYICDKENRKFSKTT